MKVEQKSFGKTPDGRETSLFTIYGAGGAKLVLSDLGARVNAIVVPDKNGVLGDVALGYADAAACFKQGRYCGATCGRYANRIRNARFMLNGKEYTLAKNDGPNTLHGGEHSFDLKVWDAAVLSDDTMRFSTLSADGEEGYPGNLVVTVDYTFTKENTLRIAYKAVCDADTVINLTNHTFFNLAGHNGGPIGGHLLQVNARYFTPIDDTLIPAGEVAPVAGTAFDFLHPAAIGARVEDEDRQLKAAGGYDHNYVLDKTARGALDCAAVVFEPESGRVMEVYTTEPGLQFYGGNFTNGYAGKDGAIYGRREAFCLEAQHFPNAVEVTHFPTPVLCAGELYGQVTEYRFSTRS